MSHHVKETTAGFEIIRRTVRRLRDLHGWNPHCFASGSA